MSTKKAFGKRMLIISLYYFIDFKLSVGYTICRKYDKEPFMSLHDIWNRYISINLNDYTNIGIDLEISKIILIIASLIVTVTVILNFRKACINNLVDSLLNNKATDEFKAKTLSELNVNNFGTKMILSDKSLRSVVGVKRESQEDEEKINLKKNKFYILRDGMTKANHIASRTTPTFAKTLLFCILIFMICVCIILIIPELLTSINSIL